jgi:predicted KAP-like P-loop ATPase
MPLKGAWGSGKTTILNNVKDKLSKENLVFIDDFEPLVYNDEKSLLVAFFDSIMKEINCGFRIFYT